MNFNKLIIARIKLLLRSVKAKRAKKKLLETFKKHPQSIRKLSAAYEKFLRAVHAEQRALVTLKAINRKYSRRAFFIKMKYSFSVLRAFIDTAHFFEQNCEAALPVILRRKVCRTICN